MASMSRFGALVAVVVAAATALPPPPSKPYDGKVLAALMNKEYHSYDPDDQTSGIGVYLRFTEDPKLYVHMPCFAGQPDGKIAGSILNDKQMRYQENGSIAIIFGKAVAWYINTTKVRTKLAKCSFAWDGGTDAKLNGGCGCFTGTQDCKNPKAAFYDKCEDGKTCTADSDMVKSCECDSKDKSTWPDSWEKGPWCFWKGPAFYPPGPPVDDETHVMLDQRVKTQSNKGAAPRENNYIQWNEMVLDGDLLSKEMKTDPVATLPAVMYIPDIHGDIYAKTAAKQMVQALMKEWNYTTPVPMIKVDTKVDVMKGGDPFVFEDVYLDGHGEITV